VSLVVGLGNPGSRYERTRHNAGWRVVETLVARWGAHPGDSSATYRSWRGAPRGREVDLMMPGTYMNLSGDAVLDWRDRHGLELGELLVVTDDVYLPIGMLRLRAGGSSGGHRGLESLAAALGGDGFARLRVGVGGTTGAELREHVLAEPTKDEAAALEESIERAADAVECWVTDGMTAAMNRFNRRIGKEDSE
jgi:PTH1 family peptidyl-tRNA hydrolase